MREVLAGIIVAVLLGAPCATPAHADNGNEVAGTLLGAGVGGLIGNQFGHGPGRVAATVGGVFLGGVIGNNIGGSFDRPSSYAAPYVYYPSPVYFQTTYVPNYVAPPAPPPEIYSSSAAAYYDETEAGYCREFTQEVRVEGQMAESYGTACLQPDGSWRVVP
jgi:surface antigen